MTPTVKITNKVFCSFLSFLLFGLMLAGSTYAVGRSDNSNRPNGQNQQEKPENRRKTITPRIWPSSGTPGAKGRERSCQAREAAIKMRSLQLTKITTNMLQKFDSIAQKVKEYYTTKVIPSGKSVSNYDTLVADISAKKGIVETALNKASAGIAAFNCASVDPKGQMRQFRGDMQAVKAALSDYRKSIKNLIVAVRAVTGEGDDDQLTSTL